MARSGVCQCNMRTPVFKLFDRLFAMLGGHYIESTARHAVLLLRGGCTIRLDTRLAQVTSRAIMNPSSPKMARQASPGCCIGTHNGKFHCDEVLACRLLRYLPQYRDSEIKRSRDPAVLATCDVVVDVGGEYDPPRHRYDHHQKSFTGNMSNLTNGSKPWGTKLSSAGLVYLHFGREIITQLLGNDQSDSIVEAIYDKVYESFIEEIDAVDNGIDQYEGGHMRYRVTTTISSRIGHLNPSWNDPNQSNPDKQLEQFSKAMDLVGKEFVDHVIRLKTIWLPGREIVQRAIATGDQVEAEFLLLFGSGGYQGNY